MGRQLDWALPARNGYEPCVQLDLISAELGPLPLPRDRERLHQLRQSWCRTPVHDPPDDVRGEQGEAQDAADIRPADLLGSRQLCEDPILTALQQPLPAVSTRERP